MLPPDYRAKAPVQESFIRVYMGPVAVRVASASFFLVSIYGGVTYLSPRVHEAFPAGRPIAWLAVVLLLAVIPVLAFKPLHKRACELELMNHHFGLALEAGEPLVSPGLAITHHREDGSDHRVSYANIHGAPGAEPVLVSEMEIIVSRPLRANIGMQAVLAANPNPSLEEHTVRVRVKRLTPQNYRLVFDEPATFSERVTFLRLSLIGASDWSTVRRVIVTA